MKRLFSIFALLTVALMLSWMAGCGGEEETEEVKPIEVKSMSVSEGASISGNTAITITFNRKAEGEVDIAVSGATGVVTWAGTIATWTPSADMTPGDHTLSISSSKVDVTGTTTVKFKATAPDKVKPKIVDNQCDPENGGTGIDPADYGEKLVVTFSEPMDTKSIKVSKLDPTDMKLLAEPAADGLSVALKFQKYTLANETKYTVELIGNDLAGNALESGVFSFTTMAKAQ